MDAQFRDMATQMYFNHATYLKMGVVEKKSNCERELQGKITDILEWNKDEIRTKGFPNGMASFLGKMSHVLQWLVDSLLQNENCTASLKYATDCETFSISSVH